MGEAMSKMLMLSFLLVWLHACTKGDTRDIYEFVLEKDLGIASISLEKEHNDNLRPGRKIKVSALAELDSGDIVDISQDVRWSSSDQSVLLSQGNGLFKAQDVTSTTTVQIIADFASYHLVVDETVSIALLSSLELGPAKSGVTGQCEIDTSITTQDQCSALSLCVLGSYVGESDKREETLYAEYTGTENSIFADGYLINSNIDLGSGPVIENLYASLDSINSPVVSITHEQNMANFSAFASSDSVVMGDSISLSVDAVPDMIVPYLNWNYSDFGLGQPEASGEINQYVFTANIEKDYISDFNNYGVDIFTSCSGKQSASVPVLITSDVNSLKIVDSLSVKEVVIGDAQGVTLTLEAYDIDGYSLNISQGDVSWYVCDLADAQCDSSAIQDEDSETFQLVADANETARDIRIEAIFHGRKAVREDFSFVSN